MFTGGRRQEVRPKVDPLGYATVSYAFLHLISINNCPLRARAEMGDSDWITNSLLPFVPRPPRVPCDAARSRDTTAVINCRR